MRVQVTKTFEYMVELPEEVFNDEDLREDAFDMLSPSLDSFGGSTGYLVLSGEDVDYGLDAIWNDDGGGWR